MMLGSGGPSVSFDAFLNNLKQQDYQAYIKTKNSINEKIYGTNAKNLSTIQKYLRNKRFLRRHLGESDYNKAVEFLSIMKDFNYIMGNSLSRKVYDKSNFSQFETYYIEWLLHDMEMPSEY